MKKTFYLLIYFVIFSLAASAQSKDEKAVASAVASFNDALIERDRATLEKLTAEELNYGHSSGKVEDQAAFIKGAVEGSFEFKTIDAQDQTIEVVGKIAIVRHVFVSEASNNGEPVNIKIGNLMVWQKNKGQWELLARQAFKI